MHGTTAANWAVQNCDCLLAIGVRLDDRVTGTLDTFAPKAKIIHGFRCRRAGQEQKVDIPIVGGSLNFYRWQYKTYGELNINGKIGCGKLKIMPWIV